jgi:predicted transposase/invertase (TIGR01784 family)
MINEIIKQEEGIAMASEVLITISKDEREQARLISREKHLLDYKSNPAYAEQVGHVKGRAEGLVKGMSEGRAYEKLEIARKMKAIGRPFTEIAEITGLTPEAISAMSSEQ